MTLWGRAFIGALIGAVVTLIAHPASRSYLVAPFFESGDLLASPRFALPASFPKSLPEPSDNISASIWVHVGAEKLVQTEVSLSRRELEGLVKLVSIRGRHDTQNAFWKVAEAVFLARLNRQEESTAAWRAAAERIAYDDYQSRNLERLRAAMAVQSAPGSWQYAYCYRLRKVALAELTEFFASQLVEKTSLAHPDDLLLRFDTIVIGNTFRDGSRNLFAMTYAAQIVEKASHPPGMEVGKGHRRLLMAHLNFKEALRAAGMEDKARRVEEIYNENDAWLAMTAREDSAEKLRNLTLMGALLPILPGVLLQCALASLGLWILGFGLQHLAKTNRSLSGLTTGILASLLPLAVLMLTGSSLAFIATALCSAFLLLSPRTPRSVAPRDLGPLFAFMNTVVAFALIFAAGLMFASRTLPFQANKEAFPRPLTGLIDPPMFAGLSLVVLACLFLFSPLWGLAQHVKTTLVLAKAIMGTAAVAAVASLILAIAATPICVSLETENQQTLEMLMKNEPVYYLR